MINWFFVSFFFVSYSYDTRLETWDDTTPRELESITVKDFDAAIAKACEEYVREIEEDDRKSLMMALEVYTKQNNMQVTTHISA